jgi:hypothetical protein
MHEFLMAKHGIPLEPVSDTQTKITYAKLFERFHKVAGMTGTARESSNSFWEQYRLSVSTCPSICSAGWQPTMRCCGQWCNGLSAAIAVPGHLCVLRLEKPCT